MCGQYLFKTGFGSTAHSRPELKNRLVAQIRLTHQQDLRPETKLCNVHQAR